MRNTERIDTARIHALLHGVGLLETTRTWNLGAPLLDRHRRRMARSAKELDLRFDESSFPKYDALLQLLSAVGITSTEARLRICCTFGNNPDTGHPVTDLWMTAEPISDGLDGMQPVDVGGRFSVAAADPLVRHKTLDQWRNRMNRARANAAGFFESLGVLPGVGIQEGSFTNVFLVSNEELHTPGIDAQILPGVMRAIVIETAREFGIAVHDDLPGLPEAELRHKLESGGELFLTNSVRGVVPVRLLDDLKLPAPGRITKILSALVLSKLISGKIDR